jgi:hypothetical protein
MDYKKNKYIFYLVETEKDWFQLSHTVTVKMQIKKLLKNAILGVFWNNFFRCIRSIW